MRPTGRCLTEDMPRMWLCLVSIFSVVLVSSCWPPKFSEGTEKLRKNQFLEKSDPLTENFYSAHGLPLLSRTIEPATPIGRCQRLFCCARTKSQGTAAECLETPKWDGCLSSSGAVQSSSVKHSVVSCPGSGRWWGRMLCTSDVVIIRDAELLLQMLLTMTTMQGSQ